MAAARLPVLRVRLLLLLLLLLQLLPRPGQFLFLAERGPENTTNRTMQWPLARSLTTLVTEGTSTHPETTTGFQHTGYPSLADSTAASTSPHPDTISASTSGPSTSELTSPGTHSAPGTGIPSPGHGGSPAPVPHRNPGVVIVVCLLVSVALIGCTLAAVTCCRRPGDVSQFNRMDEEPLGNVRLSFADPLPS